MKTIFSAMILTFSLSMLTVSPSWAGGKKSGEVGCADASQNASCGSCSTAYFFSRFILQNETCDL